MTNSCPPSTSTYLKPIAVAVLLLASGGCGESRLSLIENFKPVEGMELKSVEDVLGASDFKETEKGNSLMGEIENRSFYAAFRTDKIRVGYGSFDSSLAEGKHITKYRLNLVFEAVYPSAEFEREVSGGNIKESFDHGIYGKPKLREWHRESP
jgi:hypothetical protein